MTKIKSFLSFSKSRKGSALIVTLGILSLMLIVVMVFAFEAQSAKDASTLYRDQTKDKMTINIGLSEAISIITDDTINTTNGSANSVLRPSDNFRGFILYNDGSNVAYRTSIATFKTVDMSESVTTDTSIGDLLQTDIVDNETSNFLLF